MPDTYQDALWSIYYKLRLINKIEPVTAYRMAKNLAKKGE